MVLRSLDFGSSSDSTKAGLSGAEIWSNKNPKIVGDVHFMKMVELLIVKLNSQRDTASTFAESSQESK